MEGWDDGCDDAFIVGWEDGCSDCWPDGVVSSLDGCMEGWDDGCDDAFIVGWDEGWEYGLVSSDSLMHTQWSPLHPLCDLNVDPYLHFTTYPCMYILV
jgi:hypothetical protein